MVGPVVTQTVINDERGIRLDWTYSAFYSFEVWVSYYSNESNYRLLASLPAGTYSYEIELLPVACYYHFKVRGLFAGEYTDFSNIIEGFAKCGVGVVPVVYLTIPYSCQQSIDLYTNGDNTFVFFPMWIDRSPNGMLALIDDSQGRIWETDRGMVLNTTGWKWSVAQWDQEMHHTERLNTTVVSDTYFATAGTDLDLPQSVCIWIFRNGDITRKTIYTNSLDFTGTHYNYDPGLFAMSSNGHIVIPLVGNNYDVYGETYVSVAVSHNYGTTFSINIVATETSSGIFYNPSVAVDQSGTMWLSYHNVRGSGGSYDRIYLYKSLDNGDSWTSVNYISLPYPLVENGTTRQEVVCDGTDLYIVSGTGSRLYKSTDGGTTINLIYQWDYNLWWLHTYNVHDGVICVFLCDPSVPSHDGMIVRSTDGGSSWTTVHTIEAGVYGPYTSGYFWMHNYPRMSNSGNVWVQTAEKFFVVNEETEGGGGLLYLISTDDGVTWTDRLCPIPAVSGEFIIRQY